jgi:Subtilisin-like serine proteases
MGFEDTRDFRIVPSLRRKVERNRQKGTIYPDSEYDVIISKRDGVQIGQLIDALQRHRITIRGGVGVGHTDHYVFIRLKLLDIDRAAQIDEVDQIWPDEEGHALLDESVETIKAEAVWNTYGKFGKDVCWAVLDSGIDALHPHFQTHHYQYLNFSPTGTDILTGTVIATQNFTENKDTYDRTGHGTHVAGIIAGESKGRIRIEKEKALMAQEDPQSFSAEGIGGGIGQEPPDEEREIEIKGVAPWAKLIDLKVLDREEKTKASWVIKALFWIRSQNTKYAEIVIHGANLSLGIPFELDSYGCGLSPVCAEVNRLVNSGVVVCIAAGNRGFADLKALSGGRVVTQEHTYQDVSIEDPGNAAEGITVGSTHKAKPHLYGVSHFSSRGPTGDGRLKPDLLAPGEKIISCNHAFGPAGDFYTVKSGTSMAAPHVSGAIALLLSVKPELKGHPRVVREVLLNNCVDLKREKFFQGNGLLDILKAISAL